MKCHRCRRNGHGPVTLNNEQRFKFAMSTYNRAAHRCDQLCRDLCSHGIQRQSLWIELTTVSIAKAFIQINSISWNSEILRFYTLHWKNNVRSPTVPLDQPSWVIIMSEPKTLFEAYLISSLTDIGKHSVWEGWLVVGMHGGGIFALHI